MNSLFKRRGVVSRSVLSGAGASWNQWVQYFTSTRLHESEETDCESFPPTRVSSPVIFLLRHHEHVFSLPLLFLLFSTDTRSSSSSSSETILCLVVVFGSVCSSSCHSDAFIDHSHVYACQTRFEFSCFLFVLKKL